MKHLSRNDIETIAAKYIKAYMQLPEVKNTQVYRIDPEIMLGKILGSLLLFGWQNHSC